MSVIFILEYCFLWFIESAI